MLNQYPLWKYLLIISIIVMGVIYAIPNWYGESPALQITGVRGVAVDDAALTRIESILSDNAIEFEESQLNKKNMLIRFTDENMQLAAKALLKEQLGNQYIVALQLAPATPQWLRNISAEPMKLGLDLRGGVHFLMQVDMDTAIAQRLEQYVDDFRTQFRKERIRYSSINLETDGKIKVVLRDASNAEAAYQYVRAQLRELTASLEGNTVSIRISDTELAEIQDYAIQQNIITLRNRVNELGVAEPLVQRNGPDRIVVELPGVQDTAEAKRILGITALVELHAVDYQTDIDRALSGYVPRGSKIYRWRDGKPVVLKKRVVLTGEHITNATSGFDENNFPVVNIRLDAVGGKKFGDFTERNINKPMAVVFVEHKVETKIIDGEEVSQAKKVEHIINVATIRAKLERRFRIEGIDSVDESRELALLLRAGSLAAPVNIIEERTVGPSLGKDNIAKGVLSIQIGFIAVLFFMLVYYRLFGLVANVALGLNVVLIMAALSMIPGATLTLPGIAGIVLTVGMAVDANVLIFQRIKEEIKNGSSPQMSIHAGYERALSTIADANITTLLAALVLFAIGTGPIKGFAVTLSIGIVTSMFTAIMCTRAIVNMVYGGKSVKSLMI